jgi:hypothetical protein
MPESSERVFLVGGSRTALIPAVELLVQSLCQYQQSPEVDTWVKYVPPADKRGRDRGSGSSGTSSSSTLHSPMNVGMGARSAAFGAGRGPLPGLGHPGSFGGAMSPDVYQVMMSVPQLASSIASAVSAPDGSGNIIIELSIPHASAGAVIGRGGASIADFQSRSGAAIKVADPVPPATERIVRISGQPLQVYV